MKDELRKIIKEACKRVGIGTEFAEYIKIDYPEDPIHGDFSTNIALACLKALKTSPKELADKIVAELDKNKPEFVKEINIAGPGFINFILKPEVFAKQIVSINKDQVNLKSRIKRKVMVEYTDPNPFKIFHIGHLMSNAIGESISRLQEYSGVNVKRANWQGDVGLHVAKTIWGVEFLGIIKLQEVEKDSILRRIEFLGEAYVAGNRAYEEAHSEAKKSIDEINKKVFDKSDRDINNIYEKGRRWSLEYFELIYKRLGTKFDHYFFEGKEGLEGKKIVEKFLDEGVFEKSDGAVVFKGEKFGLHTRVFITSNGLPTYETKELGLNKAKFEVEPDLDASIIVTANEQSDYFKVLLKVMEFVYPEIARKTIHISHGILRFASGKMSSRKGNVISAESLISDIKDLVKTKISNRKFTEKESEDISEIVAVSAIKYSILRVSVGSDVIFDSSASISFEGDSGPYLQYSAVRAKSVLDKAMEMGMAGIVSSDMNIDLPDKVGNLEKLLVRFKDVAERAEKEFAPQHVASYLINLAGTFNSFYAAQVIIDKNNPLSPYYIALTKAFLKVMTDGLWILGIKIPEKM